jgi:hypothetical protein
MGLSKLLEHDMNAVGIFSLKMVLRLVKPILLSSLERLIRTYLFFDEFSRIMTDRFEMSMMG